MTLPRRIEAALKVRGLTWAELPAKAGLSPSLVAKLKGGHRGENLSAASALALAASLNCDVGWLVTGEGEAPEGVTVEPDPVELIHAEGGRERGAA